MVKWVDSSKCDAAGSIAGLVGTRSRLRRGLRDIWGLFQTPEKKYCVANEGRCKCNQNSRTIALYNMNIMMFRVLSTAAWQESDFGDSESQDDIERDNRVRCGRSKHLKRRRAMIGPCSRPSTLNGRQMHSAHAIFQHDWTMENMAYRYLARLSNHETN